MRHLPDENCQRPAVNHWPGEALPTHVQDDRRRDISPANIVALALCLGSPLSDPIAASLGKRPEFSPGYR